MGGVNGSDCRNKTENLIDRWAHDAGVVGKDERVEGRAGLKSSEEAWKGRNHATAGQLGKDAAIGVGRELLPEVLEKAAIFGALGAGAVIGSTVYGAYELYAGWADAHAKGDNIRQLAHNDSVNVALAKGLAFDSRFGADEAARRPGVEKNTAKLIEGLQGKDKDLVPVLQSRADEGFLTMERAFAATKHLAHSPERGQAMMKWLDANGFQDKRRNDVAFGKGTEYFTWLEGTGVQRGVDVAAETKKVHDRQPPDRTFACRG